MNITKATKAELIALVEEGQRFRQAVITQTLARLESSNRGCIEEFVSAVGLDPDGILPGGTTTWTVTFNIVAPAYDDNGEQNTSAHVPYAVTDALESFDIMAMATQLDSEKQSDDIVIEDISVIEVA